MDTMTKKFANGISLVIRKNQEKKGDSPVISEKELKKAGESPFFS